MRQAIIWRGNVVPVDVPAPVVTKGGVLIKVVNSCISAGTESSAVVASNQTLFKQALAQPEKIKKALAMMFDKGVAAVVEKMKGQQPEAESTGYSVSGVVLGVGEGVTSIRVGDRVAAAGAGAAHHAEFVDVPENLVSVLPEKINFKDASTVALGAIAMQGVRRADLRLGEYGVIVGAGMIGLVTLQMLKASGIRTAVVDLDDRRLEVAKQLGAELTINPARSDSVALVNSWSGGNGVDAVLFCAATGSSSPLAQAFQMCRRKGRVVLVGVSGMEICRADIYNKELDFLISTSYGPGRYDRSYEEKGVGYPYAYVRWTEGRNMQEYLRMIASGCISLDAIIEKVFPIEKVSEAFIALTSGNPKPLGVVLDYGISEERRMDAASTVIAIPPEKRTAVIGKIVKVALVGCGGFAKGTHLPNMEKMKDKYCLHAVVDKAGHIAKDVATRYGAAYATTDFEKVIQDQQVDLVLIATRHDIHAPYALKALEAGKNVFVEKPLAVTPEQLLPIKDFYASCTSGNAPILMVGFNRRFSEYARKIKESVTGRISPLLISYRMNAGYAPFESWIHEDGGRIVGEACHVIDLITYLTGSIVVDYAWTSLDPDNTKFTASDNKTILLKYKDGSVGTISYFSIGSKLLSKEYMEVHFDEKSIVMDDYAHLTGFGIDFDKNARAGKGHFEELEYLYRVLNGQQTGWPILADDLFRTTEITLDIVQEQTGSML